jgi:hypothetical protein
LLKTKPDFVVGMGFHQARGLVSVVEFVGCSIRIPGLAHDQKVVAQADRIRVHCNGSDVDIRVVAGGLASGGAIEVPFWELVNALWNFGKSLEEKKMELATGFGDAKIAQQWVLIS